MTKQMSKNGAKGAVRVEEDALGDVEVPASLCGALNHNSPGGRIPFSSMATVRRRVEPSTSFFQACILPNFTNALGRRLQISDLKALK